MCQTAFAACRRASQQLSTDNQAAMDWADDTEFRLSVTRRELREAIELLRRGALAMRDGKQATRVRQRRP